MQVTVADQTFTMSSPPEFGDAFIDYLGGSFINFTSAYSSFDDRVDRDDYGTLETVDAHISGADVIQRLNQGDALFTAIVDSVLAGPEGEITPSALYPENSAGLLMDRALHFAILSLGIDEDADYETRNFDRISGAVTRAYVNGWIELDLNDTELLVERMALAVNVFTDMDDQPLTEETLAEYLTNDPEKELSPQVASAMLQFIGVIDNNDKNLMLETLFAEERDDLFSLPSGGTFDSDPVTLIFTAILATQDVDAIEQSLGREEDEASLNSIIIADADIDMNDVIGPGESRADGLAQAGAVFFKA